jgi:hypothetical protein
MLKLCDAPAQAGACFVLTAVCARFIAWAACSMYANHLLTASLFTSTERRVLSTGEWGNNTSTVKHTDS